MRNYFVFRFSLRSIMALVFCCIGITKTVAQEERAEYVPFVEEGKVWYCGYCHPYDSYPATPEDPEGEGIDCIFTMCGDTLINSKEYKKVYCQFEEYYGDVEQHYYCAVREDAYQIFIIEIESKEEKLLYDFSSSEKIITLTYNDIKFARMAGYRRLGFLPGQMMYTVCIYSGDEIDHSNSPSSWVEGVGGALANPFTFEFSTFLFSQPKFGKYICVRSCMKDDKHIFKLEWLSRPTESSIDEKYHIDASPKGSPIYDLQGRSIETLNLKAPTSNLKKGIYIQNGKKVVVK